MKVSLALLVLLVSQTMLCCIADPVISQDLIADPNSDGLAPVRISLLYAKWNTMLVDMPVASRSYTGVANFHYQGAIATDNTLMIPFTTVYPRAPVCTFTQEGGAILLSKIESSHDGVFIHLYDAYVSTTMQNWNDVSGLRFNVVCIGAGSLQTQTGS
ncbi:uncharacterized protein LOC134189201 [Corticium candelabrum]|uniref:uncharacterized protein LOC134189201 n=1 Tax=Corticium candelabrum TaxID=121492 RepID=UPI002E27686F|nr:uncharacterized protein LOC134189201 [Corticium candelabrum]